MNLAGVHHPGQFVHRTRSQERSVNLCFENPSDYWEVSSQAERISILTVHQICKALKRSILLASFRSSPEGYSSASQLWSLANIAPRVSFIADSCSSAHKGSHAPTEARDICSETPRRQRGSVFSFAQQDHGTYRMTMVVASGYNSGLPNSSSRRRDLIAAAESLHTFEIVQSIIHLVLQVIFVSHQAIKHSFLRNPQRSLGRLHL